METEVKKKVDQSSLTEEELLERIQTEQGCPICSAILDFEFNQISHVQYDVTYIEEIRKQVAREGGFCDFHFRQFKKIANGKTNILLLKSVVEESAYKKNNFIAECRICVNVNKYEENLIKVFVNLILRKEIRSTFENTNGICFVHLRQVNNLLEDEIIKKWLNEIHVQQIERMQSDFENMSQFKSFYEIERKKRRLINILIEKLAGRKTGAL
ncbi:MAG: hypothetical protein WCE54_19545 [Ignavibacteriaceae bacterium]